MPFAEKSPNRPIAANVVSERLTGYAAVFEEHVVQHERDLAVDWRASRQPRWSDDDRAGEDHLLAWSWRMCGWYQ